MTLEQMNVLAAAWALLGIIIIFTRTAYIRTRPKKTISDAEETDNVSVRKLKQQVAITEKDIRTVRFMTILSIICLVISLTLVFISGYYRTQAIACGAEGDIDKQPISEIKYFTDNGFADQSDMLPEDLNGAIIIYFLYGCHDCIDIHDDLMSMLSTRNMENIYFVSVSSEKGKTLFDTHFPANGREVPSAAYISETDVRTVLLFEPSNANNGKSTFIADNLQTLIDLQERRNES